MTSADVDEDSTDTELEDLLTDDLAGPQGPESTKGRAAPLVRSKAQAARTVAQDEKLRLKQEQDAQALRDKAAAAQLAQIVNLHIAGISFTEIGASIGCSADEIERMLTQDTIRYVRSQPALRVYVRNFVSAKYSELLAAVWDEATDKNHEEKLENLREARQILDKMARLHGAEAPVQSEVKVDAAPEAIDRMVTLLAAQAGRAYDMEIFDADDPDDEEIYPADIVEESQKALTVSGNALEETGDDDEF
jgi:hypothetical protein